ncbi:uncharacterized protein PG986_004076 [Apiospora aurea]|uniref:Uncharacterized protein n=1 Tax=Apiospora aurea TaxID=335848 RepID=A0ABR1QLJ1_9PEZI
MSFHVSSATIPMMSLVPESPTVAGQLALALIPLAFAILLTICITAVTGSRRERILGVQNPANEKVLKQLRDEHMTMREGQR